MGQAEVLAIVKQAAKEEVTELDLSNNSLTELPCELFGLTKLKKLDLRALFVLIDLRGIGIWF